jgi:hypothetical protein
MRIGRIKNFKSLVKNAIVNIMIISREASI